MQCELVHARARVRVRPCECPDLLGEDRGNSMAAAREGDPCPKCGTKLSSVLCAPCYGTGRSGKRACKNCGGSGVKIGCPNFRAHRLWPFIRKRVVPQSSAERAKAAWWSSNYNLLDKRINPFRREK